MAEAISQSAARPTVDNPPNSLPPAGAFGKRPHVTIRGLGKRFEKSVIYENFDLDIPRGELISIFGPKRLRKKHADKHDRRTHST